jgi:hypothetical protein
LKKGRKKERKKEKERKRERKWMKERNKGNVILLFLGGVLKRN